MAENKIERIIGNLKSPFGFVCVLFYSSLKSHGETSSGRKINNRSFAAKSSTTPRDF